MGPEPTKKSTPESAADEGTFAKLFARHEREIYAFIFSLVPNWNDADDIMQETCSALWESFADYRAGTSFVAWASQVAYYRVLRHRRKFMRDKLTFHIDMDVIAAQLLTQVDELEAQRDVLSRCLQKLSEADRLLLKVCYSAGESLKNLAEQLRRPVKSVYRRLGKVRRRLFDCVRQGLPTEEGA